MKFTTQFFNLPFYVFYMPLAFLCSDCISQVSAIFANSTHLLGTKNFRPPLAEVVIITSLESLSNNEGDGYENVTLK